MPTTAQSRPAEATRPHILLGSGAPLTTVLEHGLSVPLLSTVSWAPSDPLDDSTTALPSHAWEPCTSCTTCASVSRALCPAAFHGLCLGWMLCSVLLETIAIFPGACRRGSRAGQAVAPCSALLWVLPLAEGSVLWLGCHNYTESLCEGALSIWGTVPRSMVQVPVFGVC